MQHQAVIGLGDDAGRRINLGDRVLYPMQRNQGQQGRNASPAVSLRWWERVYPLHNP